MNDPIHEPPPRQLPRRPPRQLGVHALVDSGVAFLVVIIPLLFFRVPLSAIVLIGLMLGAVLAPFSRRYEMQMLAKRPEAEAEAEAEAP